jgi:putative ABC transport system ATP-binding protein
MPAPVIARDVYKIYGASQDAGVRALDGVSLDVEAGEMVALVGPSGCGKSTLLNLVGCVDLPTRGSVVVDGARTSELGDDGLTRLRRDRVGTIFQFFNLLPALTIEERVPPAEIEQRTREALEAVGIAAKRRAYPATVSGGEMQRAAIARAIVHRPAIVLADEPTGNLDSANGAMVLALLHELRGRGQTILMATHSDEAAAASNRVIRMRDGRLE